MFRFRSVFARETCGESALRGVCVTGIRVLERALIGVKYKKSFKLVG